MLWLCSSQSWTLETPVQKHQHIKLSLVMTGSGSRQQMLHKGSASGWSWLLAFFLRPSADASDASCATFVVDSSLLPTRVSSRSQRALSEEPLLLSKQVLEGLGRIKFTNKDLVESFAPGDSDCSSACLELPRQDKFCCLRIIEKLLFLAKTRLQSPSEL